MSDRAPHGSGILFAVTLVLAVGGDGLARADSAELGVKEGLQQRIDAAADGDVVEVPPGRWAGPIVVDKPITLRGAGGTIDGRGEGIVLRVAAAGAVVEGLDIENSGRDLTGLSPDSCIRLDAEARGAILRGNTVRDCAFGIWVHQTPGAHIIDNRVHGAHTGHRSERGNGIHLFDATELVVRANHVTGGRDGIYVSATEDSLIEANEMERTRYGIHYMFSYSNTVRDNHAHHNGSGLALMQSHYLTVTDNVVADNTGHGILFRDARECEIRRNRLVRNGQGLFFFSSTENVIADNEIAQNEVGARIWAGSVRNRVENNAFVGNRRQVMYMGSSDLDWGVDAPGNLWGDYLGWDQSGDGLGDRPYRVDSFTTNLTYQYPAAALLLRSPSLELLSHLERHLPFLRTPTVIDHQPRMQREAR
jgi:nitrous oxidase accessory protein